MGGIGSVAGFGSAGVVASETGGREEVESPGFFNPMSFTGFGESVGDGGAGHIFGSLTYSGPL